MPPFVLSRRALLLSAVAAAAAALPLPAFAATKNILVFGDSLVAGLGLAFLVLTGEVGREDLARLRAVAARKKG